MVNNSETCYGQIGLRISPFLIINHCKLEENREQICTCHVRLKVSVLIASYIHARLNHGTIPQRSDLRQ